MKTFRERLEISVDEMPCDCFIDGTCKHADAANAHLGNLPDVLEQVHAALESLYTEAVHAKNWYATSGMKVAQSPRLPPSVAIKIERELSEPLAALVKWRDM